MAGITWWNGTPFGFFANKDTGLMNGVPAKQGGKVAIEDFAGAYAMNHDGWQGTLKLWVRDMYTSTIGNIGGTYTPSGKTSTHNVRGFVQSQSNISSSGSWPDHKIELYIDFSDTSSTSDDQKFVGYLFTQTKSALAGKTCWNSIPFGFYAEKQRPPHPKITANGKNGHLTVGVDKSIDIAVQLDPGVLQIEPCDWWIIAVSPKYGSFSYTLQHGWVFGFNFCLQAPSISLLTPVSIFQAYLPPGDFTFYFALDDEKNGQVDGNIWWDNVSVTITD